MSTQHTPGRWHANIHDGGQYFANITADLGKREDGVGLICTIAVVLKYAQPSEREANARLIAAAPDMLAALQFVFEHIADKERGPRDLYPAFGLNSSRAVEHVRAAIAKATGAA